MVSLARDRRSLLQLLSVLSIGRSSILEEGRGRPILWKKNDGHHERGNGGGFLDRPVNDRGTNDRPPHPALRLPPPLPSAVRSPPARRRPPAPRRRAAAAGRLAPPPQRPGHPGCGHPRRLRPASIHQRAVPGGVGLPPQVLAQHDAQRPHLRGVVARRQDARQGDDAQNERRRPLRRGARQEQTSGAAPPPPRGFPPGHRLLHARRPAQESGEHVQPGATQG